MDNKNTNNSKVSFFSGSIFGYTWKSRAIVFGINIFFVVVFGLIGFLLANKFNKSPKTFVILSLIFSFPVSQYFIYRKLRVK